MECKSNIPNVRSAVKSRINRYIMECKFCCFEKFLKVSKELIDTLWNVNSNEYTYRQVIG